MTASPSELPADVLDLGGPDGGRFWQVTSDHPSDHPDALSAAVHARATGSVGATYNGVTVARFAPDTAPVPIAEPALYPDKPKDLPLPVFPWTDGQVAEVADALAEQLNTDREDGQTWELAKTALAAAARVMNLEHGSDPMGYPTGYGYRTVRGVTRSFVVKPDGTWVPQED